MILKMMSSQFSKAIFLVLSGWLIWFFIFVGIGVLIRRKFFNLKMANFESLLSSFWIGWAYTIFFLQLWNLCFKIDWCASLLVCIVGVAGLIWNYKDLLQIIKKGNFLQKIILSSALSLIVLWIADFAILSPLVYDSGLYHLTSISWLKSYPIIPGLGNLNSRLAFNNSYFLYVSMLDFGPWIQKSQHLANGLILSVLIIQIFLSGMTFFRHSSKISLYHIFYILFLGPVLTLTVTLSISSPSPDMSIYILGILVSAKLLAFLEEQNYIIYIIRENEYNIFFILTIATLGITIKLSFAVFSVVSLILLFIFCLMKDIGNKEKNIIKKILFIYVFCIGIALMPWMVRGIILSGYVAYPSTFGTLPVDWRIPYTNVIGMANSVLWWARTLGGQLNKELENWNWIMPWISRMFKIENRYFTIHIAIPLFLIFINSILIFFSKYLKKYSVHNMKKNIWLILVPSICSILFWFIAAPLPRFVGACFWILGVGTSIIVINKFNVLKSKYFKTFIISFSIILCIGFFFIKIFVNIPEENNGFYKIPSVGLKIFETNSGLNIYIPEKGDQCWDAPLPCAPYPNADLCLRREGEMRYGFKIYPRNE